MGNIRKETQFQVRNNSIAPSPMGRFAHPTSKVRPRLGIQKRSSDGRSRVPYGKADVISAIVTPRRVWAIGFKAASLPARWKVRCV